MVTASTTYQIIRKPEVLRQTGFSRSTLHTRIKQQRFVSPIPLGERAVGFVASEVNSCVAAMIAGKSQDEMKALVASLIEQRKTALEAIRG